MQKITGFILPACCKLPALSIDLLNVSSLISLPSSTPTPLPSQPQNHFTSSSRLLTDANILKRINKLLDNEVLNDSFVDKQLLLVITQNADMSSKVQAIKEYNKLKQRIEERIKMHSQVEVKNFIVELSNEADNQTNEGV